MSTKISDIQSDKSFKVLFNKLQDFTSEATELIKTAGVNYDELAELPSTAFAWPEMRKFAMHNKEHAAISMIYAHDEEIPEHVKSNLEKAAALYEINLEELPLNKVASEEEVPFNEDDYLLPERAMCKVASANDIKLSVDFLERNGRVMDVMALAHANKVLCKKASEFDVKLPTKVYQEAGLTKCNLEKLAEWLEVRTLESSEQKHKEAYTKLAEVLSPSNNVPVTRSSLLKVATTIAIVDEESGIASKYKRGIATPMASVFNTEKIAEETIYFAGHNVPVANFMKVNEDVYANILGDDVLPEITSNGVIDDEKLMDIITTLPADIQQALLPYVLSA